MRATPDNPYTRMQVAFYTGESLKWSPEGKDRDAVVGPYDEHNAWPDYELLFEGIVTGGRTPHGRLVALDFGCGPGRMMMKYRERFKRIDGADLSEHFCHVARGRYEEESRRLGLAPFTMVHKVNGVDLDVVPDASYDVVYSALCLQHIPVHSIRSGLFKEFFRVLKPGGWFTAQMGYGDTDDPHAVPYHEDRWDAPGTNSACDVKVTHVVELLADLRDSGFGPETASCTVRPVGPGDWHPNWVWFRAQKPEHK